jgi:hypothetical protein
MFMGRCGLVFTVKKDRVNEANSIIPLLCLIVEAKFGKRSCQWFTDNARLTSEGFYWDVTDEQLKQTDDLMEAADDDNFSLDSDDCYVANLIATLKLGNLEDIVENGSVFHFDLDFVLNAAAPSNQYGDQGSVKTFREACEQTTQQEKAAAQNAAPAAMPAVDNSAFPKQHDQLAGTDIDTANSTEATQASTLTDPANMSILQQMMTILQLILLLARTMGRVLFMPA